jgi:CRISPR-associated protein Cas5h
MKVLIFDLRGDYGHFRAYYSTSSPVSFSVIPPTALFGIIGAILGLPKENNEYLKILNRAKTKVAIKINNPIKKTRLGINLINTKGNIWVPKRRREGPRTPIKYEFLKEPGYRIFVTMEDKEVFRKLINMVQNHQTHYTISLGLSELLADVSYVGLQEYVFNESESDYVEVSTVVPLKDIIDDGILVKEGMQFLKERIPFRMNTERVVEEYGQILMEVKGKKMNLKLKRYWKTEDGNENIVFI